MGISLSGEFKTFGGAAIKSNSALISEPYSFQFTTGSNLGSHKRGVLYAVNIYASTTPDRPITFTANGSMPFWANLNTGDSDSFCIVNGNPISNAAIGVNTFTLDANNGIETITRTFTLTINP